MPNFYVVEKANHLHVHAHCHSRDTGDYWIAHRAPEYCAKGYFMDKTLTPDSFEVIPIPPADARKLRKQK